MNGFKSIIKGYDLPQTAVKELTIEDLKVGQEVAILQILRTGQNKIVGDYFIFDTITAITPKRTYITLKKFGRQKNIRLFEANQDILKYSLNLISRGKLIDWIYETYSTFIYNNEIKYLSISKLTKKVLNLSERDFKKQHELYYQAFHTAKLYIESIQSEIESDKEKR